MVVVHTPPRPFRGGPLEPWKVFPCTFVVIRHYGILSPSYNFRTTVYLPSPEAFPLINPTLAISSRVSKYPIMGCFCWLVLHGILYSLERLLIPERHSFNYISSIKRFLSYCFPVGSLFP